MLIRPRHLIPILVVSLLILVFSLMPDPPEPKVDLPYLDKFEHIAAYALLGFLMFRVFDIERMGRMLPAFLISLVLCMIYGGSIEYLQQFTGRTVEVMDFFANGVGAALGAGTALCLHTVTQGRTRKAGRPDGTAR